MGFNLYGLGNIHKCWIKDHKVFYEQTASGAVYSYDTALDVEIPPQKNLFVSDNVAFLLYHDGKEYIGRYDGVISVYRQSDDMLVGLSNWNPPTYPPLKTCGYYRTPVQIEEIFLDLRDQVTVYTKWHNQEAKLSKPLNLKLDESWLIVNYEMDATIGTWHILDEGGVPVEVDVWFVQNEVWRRNCPIFL